MATGYHDSVYKIELRLKKQWKNTNIYFNRVQPDGNTILDKINFLFAKIIP